MKMSERTARLMEQGKEKYDSAEEAWEATKEQRGNVDWDFEKMPDIAELMEDDDE